MDDLIAAVTNLRDETRKALNDRPRWMTFDKIERETGLSQPWLSKFSHGKIPNPGVVFIETLSAYLKTQRTK